MPRHKRLRFGCSELHCFKNLQHCSSYFFNQSHNCSGTLFSRSWVFRHWAVSSFCVCVCGHKDSRTYSREECKANHAGEVSQLFTSIALLCPSGTLLFAVSTHSETRLYLLSRKSFPQTFLMAFLFKTTLQLLPQSLQELNSSIHSSQKECLPTFLNLSRRLH
jgi:hypothetical protein